MQCHRRHADGVFFVFPGKGFSAHPGNPVWFSSGISDTMEKIPGSMKECPGKIIQEGFHGKR